MPVVGGDKDEEEKYEEKEDGGMEKMRKMRILQSR